VAPGETSMKDGDERVERTPVTPAASKRGRAELTMHPHPLTPDGAELYARFFRALGDPTRVRILELLLMAPDGEYSVGELVATLEAPQARVSTHLGCLRWCGLVQARRDGKLVYYRVADPRVREVLQSAGAVVHDHAAGVASCGMVR
jgi:ArsR family transcriptional regulator, cadmium/lead-responsive transcriptional repressor